MKLLAAVSVATVALGVSACGGKEVSGGDTGNSGETKTKIGLAYDIGGRGDKSFNDAAAVGLDKIKSEYAAKVDVKELEAAPTESESDKYARLKLLCTEGYNPVVAVGFVYAGNDPANGPLAKAAKDCPNTKFAIIDDSSATASNIANLVFAEHQGSFLVGAAAALKSQSGQVGFVGGCLVPLIQKFEAGYKAGVEQVNKDEGKKVTVNVKYLSTPAEKCSGFNDPAKGKTTAEGQYDAGADIVYQAAGGSGSGVFQAATAKQKLAIGVDSDQYNTADPSVRDVIITSMLKKLDVAIYDFLKGYVDNGTFKSGTAVFDLKANGVDYSTTGGKVDDIKSKLDAYKAKIVSGEIKVPETVSS
jgi:basic membrane protein A